MKNIAKRGGVKITDDEIREILSINKEDKVNNKSLVKFYSILLKLILQMYSKRKSIEILMNLD